MPIGIFEAQLPASYMYAHDIIFTQYDILWKWQVAVEVDRFFTMQEEGNDEMSTENAAMYLVDKVIQSAADKQGLQVMLFWFAQITRTKLSR
jgi:hypothetical protein